MNTTSLIAIALAALLVFAGGAAALPSQATGADAADEHQPDDPGADATNETDADGSPSDGNVTDADDARDENATDAPPTEMPEEAPDHVSQIHELVRDKLDGALTGQELGEAISGLLGNGDDAQANSQADSAGEQAENATAKGKDARANAGPTGDLPEQATDHVSQIHDVIQSWLNGDGEGNLGDEVSASAV